MSNFSQICSALLKSLPEKQRKIITNRFGLDKEGRRATLELIGKKYGITRERVRQIENSAFSLLEEGGKKYPEVFQYFKDYLKKQGGLKREDLLLSELGKNNRKNQVYFLLNLKKDFKRIGENADFYAFWTIERDSAKFQEIINSAIGFLKKKGTPQKLSDLANVLGVSQKTLASCLEVSKKIQSNSEKLFGLVEWPEIKPKGVRDLAFLTFKKEKKPLHYVSVANLIGSALPQTVHNELIKDSRFVLIGRGTYALKEWGYKEGMVKDIISQALKESKRPLKKEEILKQVLKQRQVKENTVFLNLSNKNYFLKDSGGGYKIKHV